MSARTAKVLLGALLGAVLACGGAAAAFTATTGNAGNNFSAASDFVAPQATAVALVKSEGGEPGYIRASGSYYAYIDAPDTGAPASGTTSVTADAGNGAFGLPAGSFAFGGRAYDHRSALQTAPAGTTAGAKTLSIALGDQAGNSRTASSPFTVDNVRPAPTDVQALNGGGSSGRPDAGDTLTYTYTEPIDRESLIAGWTEGQDPRNVVVRIIDGDLGTDTVQVFNAANTAQIVSLGTTDLGSGGYVNGDRTYGAAGTPSTIARTGNTFVITLGSSTGSILNGSLITTSMTWTPGAGAFDRAGNTATTPTVTEGGPADREF